ncbi:zinc finger, CCHC-type containing protein [Tanacetum coccineum]
MGDEILSILLDITPNLATYRNTIELPEGNNVVPLRSDTIWLVQNGCSFHGLRSEDPNQHLKDFLKLMDSLDLDEDLTTRFLAQFFPAGRTAKLGNDILIFQQHQGESLSEAWTRFKDLLQKVPHHGIDRWLQIQIFYNHVSFHLKCEIHCAAGGKHRNKNADKPCEIIENLALYDHEGWNDSKDHIKPVKGVAVSPNASKTYNLRLLELEDQINFLLKGPQRTPKTSSTHETYAKAVSSSPLPRDHNKPPRQSYFTFRERVRPNPQPQALETSFEARVRDYMAAHTERMKRFKNTISKQREEINDRMSEMFGLLKELTTSRTLVKVLIREEARHPVTKNVNSISLIRMEEEKNGENNGPINKSIMELGKSDEEEPPK